MSNYGNIQMDLSKSLDNFDKNSETEQNLVFAFSTQNAKTLPQHALPNSKVDTYFLERLITCEAPKAKDECARLARLYYEGGDVNFNTASNNEKGKLPYFLPSGFCAVHHNDASLEYNGCVQMDIDFKFQGGDVKAIEIKNRIIDLMQSGVLPYFVFVAISPRLYGVKALVYTDNKNKEYHKSLVQVLKTELSSLFNIDSKSIDNLSLSQPCFVPFDKTAYFNHNPEPYHYTHVEPVKKVVKIEKTIAAPTENNGTTEFALTIAQKLSLCEAITDTYSLNGRNDRTFRVACLASQNEIDFNTALEHCLQFEETDFQAKEIEQCVKSAYKSAKNKVFNDFQLYSYGLRSGVIPAEIQSLYENRKRVAKGDIAPIDSAHTFPADSYKLQPIRLVEGLKDEYLSTTLERVGIPINHSLFSNTLLVANTGTGKGRIIEMLASQGRPLFVLTPLENLTKQTAKRINKYENKNICVAYCGKDKEDFDINSNCKIWCVTYASFPNLCKRIAYTYGEKELRKYNVIADECHYFTSAASAAFMLKPLREAAKYISMCGNMLAMTATPLKSEHSLFKCLNLLNVQTPMYKPPVRIIETKDNILAVSEMVAEAVLQGIKCVVLLKSKSVQLERLKGLFDKIGTGDGIAYDKKICYKEFNTDTKTEDHFQEIVEKSSFSDDIDVLICTPVLKEGIDIKNDCEVRVFGIGTDNDALDMKQAAYRYRTAIKNGKVSVFIVLNEFKGKRIAEQPTAFPFGWNKAIKRFTNIAEACADVMNDSEFDVSTEYMQVLKTSDVAPIVRNENGVYEKDTLLISNLAYEHQRKYTYVSEAAFKQAFEEMGFEYIGISQYTTGEYKPLKENDPVKAMDIFKEVCNHLLENRFEAKQIIEKGKKNKHETKRLIYKGFEKVLKYYASVENMVFDAKENIKSVKKTAFELFRQKAVVAALEKTDVIMRSNEPIPLYIKDMLNIDTSNPFTGDALKEVYLSIARKYDFSKQTAKEVEKMKRINRVISKLEAFFEVKAKLQRDGDDRFYIYELTPLKMNVQHLNIKDHDVRESLFVPTGLLPSERSGEVPS